MKSFTMKLLLLAVVMAIQGDAAARRGMGHRNRFGHYSDGDHGYDYNGDHGMDYGGDYSGGDHGIDYSSGGHGSDYGGDYGGDYHVGDHGIDYSGGDHGGDYGSGDYSGNFTGGDYSGGDYGIDYSGGDYDGNFTDGDYSGGDYGIDYSGGDYDGNFTDGDYSGGDYGIDYSGGDYDGNFTDGDYSGDYSGGDYNGGDYSGGDYSGGDYGGGSSTSGGSITKPTVRPTTGSNTAAPPPPSGDCKCAKYSALKMRIVGGTTTRRGEFPWQAALFGTHGQQQCGGTLINARWVVTANHCVPNGIAANTIVTLGDHDVTKADGETRYKVQKIVKYPTASSNFEKDDIALLKLDRAVTFSDKIKPACLPFKYATDNFEGKSVWITGWGSMSTVHAITTPAQLRKVFVSIVTNQKCKQTYGDNTIKNTHICLGNPGKSACAGDSGGPAVWVNPATSHAYLVGVTSFGDQDCSSGATFTPGVYTRVTTYLQWIKKTTQGDGICSA